MVRSRHDVGCPVLSGTECESYVLRTVWDGDQVLVESRWPGADSVRGYDQPGGMTAQVTYTNMAGLDRPVSVIKAGQTLIPHENWRGVFEDGHLAGTTTHPSVAWPGSQQRLDQGPTVAGLTTIYEWWGDVLTGGTDGSGQKYMRNRYYDPSKGTFSQKDPIGLAGGINLYGYAGANPVNYSDRYGLAADSRDCTFINVTVTDSSGTRTFTQRVCDSQDRAGQAGWERGSWLDNLITTSLKGEPGAGFTPGNGTVYVNNIADEGAVVHEVAHELDRESEALLRYQEKGVLTLLADWTIGKLMGWSVYDWDNASPYAGQNPEARAAADEACYLNQAGACARTPRRFRLP